MPSEKYRLPSYKAQAKSLLEDLDKFDWSPVERQCIQELATLKGRYDHKQQAAITSLVWRRERMKEGSHRNWRPVYGG